MPSKFRYAVVLLIWCISQSTLPLAANAAKCHSDDEAGLLGLKSAITADPSGMLAQWRPGSAASCCDWPGVACRIDDRVTELNLYGDPSDPKKYLSGTVPASLSKLGYLTGIYFVNLRNLTGAFPSALFHLLNLTYVYVENSQLSGPLPSTLGRVSQLAALSLAGNRLSGPIPASISSLTALTQLNLARNLLSGPIPLGLRRLTRLSFLDLSYNSLSGAVPDLNPFSSLRILALSHNRLRGPVPPSLPALRPTLAYLELGHNRLSGQIPPFLGSFTNLDTLDLSGNLLTGAVPDTFKNLTKIFNLDLSHNQLTDPFPPMNVRGIESLHLSGNRFHLGEIPRWATESPIIYSLKLAGCGINMDLSSWSPKQTYFYDFIDFSDNNIVGSPVNLLNRTEFLKEFRVSGNRLRFDLGGLKVGKSLETLDLSRNSIFGKVPASVVGVKNLNVSYNHLCGRIPANKLPPAAFVGNDCLCGSPLPRCKA